MSEQTMKLVSASNTVIILYVIFATVYSKLIYEYPLKLTRLVRVRRRIAPQNQGNESIHDEINLRI